VSSGYVLSPAARADLEQIWDYTCAEWGEDQAERYVRDIQRGIELVVVNPLMGRSCDEVRAGYRRHSVRSHGLYYRVERSGVITVVRVLHKHMDVDRHLD
jgi:toxin ParE1/3/4